MFRQMGAALLLLSITACAGTNQPAQPSASVAVAKPIGNLLAVADATREDGRFSEAMQIYQEILVSDPKSAAAQYGIAESLLGLGKPGDARQMFEALAQDPTLHAVAVQGKGLSLLALGQRE